MNETTVTVMFHKYDNKIWHNFKGKLIKCYEKSVMLDIYGSDAFTEFEKQKFNNRIVVSKKWIVEKDAVSVADWRDDPTEKQVGNIRRGMKHREKYASKVAEAASKSNTLTEVAKRVGKSTKFVSAVAREYNIDLPHRNNGHEEFATY